ncbi:MAG: hypothetical protein LBL57_09990 [Tannerella sp.]|jgi:hypothetical protein|nr:hypothetical protein [Tannerella sp.]
MMKASADRLSCTCRQLFSIQRFGDDVNAAVSTGVYRLQITGRKSAL